MRVLASPAFVNRWLNPYNWLLNAHLVREGVRVQGATPWRLLRGQGELWHLHWPEHSFNARSAARASVSARTWLHLAREARRAGLRIVWTVHNVRAHDGRHPEREARFWEEFLPLVDGVVHLSQAGRLAAEARFPGLVTTPHWTIPHGHYRGEYRTLLDRDAARARLGLPAGGPLVLCSGRLRPYKNVPALLDAVRALPDPALRCLVTGASTDPELRRTVEAAARGDTRIHLDLRHLRKSELATAHAAADLVVLPYREILNSGSALLALSLDRPVLVPRQGAMAELADAVGHDWVRCYDGPLTADVLAEALAWARETPRAASAPLDAFAWPAIARAHRDAYTLLTQGDRWQPPVTPRTVRVAPWPIFAPRPAGLAVA
jgi:glycosyltransferase involved in cell wall biosynthesis